MTRRLFTRRRIIVLVAILLLAASLLPRDKAAAISGVPHDLIYGTLLTPFAHPLHRFSIAIRPPEVPEHESYQKILEDRNNLWRYTRALEEEVRTLRESLGQLRMIGESLNTQGLTFVQASVTAADPGRQMLTINAGQRDGVRPQVIAVHGINLVGEVSDAAHATATVRLITAPQTPIGIRFAPAIPGAPARNVITNATPLEGGLGFAAEIGQEDPVQVGDLAHVYNDERLPHASGWVVGRVVRIEKMLRVPLRRSAIIEPQVRFTSLGRVMVVVHSDAGGR